MKAKNRVLLAVAISLGLVIVMSFGGARPISIAQGPDNGPQLTPQPGILKATPTPPLELKRELENRVLQVASSAPPNDDFDSATLITSYPFTDVLDTTGATVASDDPNMGCGAGVNSNTVWYRLIAPFSGVVEADTAGSNYDTVLAAFTGSRGGEANERIVEPYHIMPYGRSWHLIAYDHRRQEVLQFKVDRVEEAELLDTSYAIPADFDPDVYLGDSWGVMRGAAGEPEEVELLFEPEAGRWVAEEHWHKSQQSETLPDGRVRVTFHVGITPEMVSWLLYYGARVQVVAPEWLLERVAEEHRRAVEVYTTLKSSQSSPK